MQATFHLAIFQSFWYWEQQDNQISSVKTGNKRATLPTGSSGNTLHGHPAKTLAKLGRLKFWSCFPHRTKRTELQLLQCCRHCFPACCGFFFSGEGTCEALWVGGYACRAVKVTWYSDSAQQVTLSSQKQCRDFLLQFCLKHIRFSYHPGQTIKCIRVKFYLLWRGLLVNLDSIWTFFFRVLKGTEPWRVWLDIPSFATKKGCCKENNNNACFIEKKKIWMDCIKGAKLSAEADLNNLT